MITLIKEKENNVSKLNLETATIDELEEECQKVEGTNYGHNIIGIICRVTEKRFGKEEAERLFNDYQG